MNLRAALIALSVLGIAAPAAAPARAQSASSAADALIGKAVISSDGKTLGVVERAITTADGRVRQVLVRTRKGSATILRTLPFGSLSQGEKGLTTVLSEAEYVAIPPSQTE